MRLRTRPTWILASGALALSLVGAPAVMAAEPSADDPVATVNTLLDTMIAKDFAGIATLVCAEKREEVTANFDLTQAFAGMPPGVDMQMLIDALILETPDREITLVSNDGAVAIVDVVATMTISLEEEAREDLHRPAPGGPGPDGDRRDGRPRCCPSCWPSSARART